MGLLLKIALELLRDRVCCDCEECRAIRKILENFKSCETCAKLDTCNGMCCSMYLPKGD
jgi:hypothetical protein